MNWYLLIIFIIKNNGNDFFFDTDSVYIISVNKAVQLYRLTDYNLLHQKDEPGKNNNYG